MTRDEAVSRFKAELGDKLLSVEEKTPARVFADADPTHIVEISRLLFADMGARLQTASGVDTRDAMEILYHWALDTLECVITVRVSLDRDKPEIASITPVCIAAEWVEREMWELLGIQFAGHPDMRHLLLADDWPEGQYPLRRDYKGDSV